MINTRSWFLLRAFLRAAIKPSTLGTMMDTIPDQKESTKDEGTGIVSEGEDTNPRELTFEEGAQTAYY